MPPQYLLIDRWENKYPIDNLTTIGSAESCGIRLNDPTVSRDHATLWVDGDNLYIRDDNSLNGSMVNGARLYPGQAVLLRDKNTITIGSITFRVQFLHRKKSFIRFIILAFFLLLVAAVGLYGMLWLRSRTSLGFIVGISPTASKPKPSAVITISANSTQSLVVTVEPDAATSSSTQNDATLEVPPTVIVPDLPSGRIYFFSERDGNAELYLMNPDGSGQERLTNQTAYDGYPACSPDGLTLLYYSDQDGSSNIFWMDSGGGSPTQLTFEPTNQLFPAWSPDWLRIAFNTDRDGNSEIYLMNADGTNQVNLTNYPSDDRRPAWSPDSKQIAFQSDRSGAFEIYTTVLEGGTISRLTSDGKGNIFPAWSPDGQRIAFFSNRDGNWEIYIMNSDGTEQTNLTNNPAYDGFPAWSPDGKNIVYQSTRDGNAEIYVMNADGSDPTRLTVNQSEDGGPYWCQ